MNGRAAYVRATPPDLHGPLQGESQMGAWATPTSTDRKPEPAMIERPPELAGWVAGRAMARQGSKIRGDQPAADSPGMAVVRIKRPTCVGRRRKAKRNRRPEKSKKGKSRRPRRRCLDFSLLIGGTRAGPAAGTLGERVRAGEWHPRPRVDLPRLPQAE